MTSIGSSRNERGKIKNWQRKELRRGLTRQGGVQEEAQGDNQGLANRVAKEKSKGIAMEVSRKVVKVAKKTTGTGK